MTDTLRQSIEDGAKDRFSHWKLPPFIVKYTLELYLRHNEKGEYELMKPDGKIVKFFENYEPKAPYEK